MTTKWKVITSPEHKLKIKREAARKVMMAVLRARFKNVPEDVNRQISMITDLALLESLAIHAAQEMSLDIIIKNIGIAVQIERKPT